MTNRAAGFFKAFFGSCCGREVFYTLRLHSWGRCLWHLFILSFITGLIIGNAQHSRVQSVINASQAVFTELFGEEVFVKGSSTRWNWIAPVADPLKAREMPLPGGGRFFYTGCSRQIPDSLKLASGPVVVWSPLQLGVSLPGPGGSGNCMIIDTSTGHASSFSGTSSALESIFKKAPEKLPYPVSELRKESVPEFFAALSVFFSFFGVAGRILWNFFITLLYTGIFMGMYRLLNGPSGRLRFLTLKEMWKCGIYASFPVMAVASLFPVFELPLISYETVFMIGLLIYWMAVTTKLEHTPFDDEVNDANQQQ